jgi:hypothetical protein
MRYTVADAEWELKDGLDPRRVGPSSVLASCLGPSRMRRTYSSSRMTFVIGCREVLTLVEGTSDVTIDVNLSMSELEATIAPGRHDSAVPVSHSHGFGTTEGDNEGVKPARDGVPAEEGREPRRKPDRSSSPGALFSSIASRCTSRFLRSLRCPFFGPRVPRCVISQATPVSRQTPHCGC